ncbi:hypothetical protein L7F22_059092 [Adiantum nelumboides]|nr:hypothetical protein [Adiantum nelumboides]
MAINKMKKMSLEAPTLRKVDYKYGRPVTLTVDTSPTGIRWALGQDDDEGHMYAVRFGAKVLNARQRGYSEVKRELWGVVIALKYDKGYFIGASIVVGTGQDNPIDDMLSRSRVPAADMLASFELVVVLEIRAYIREFGGNHGDDWGAFSKALKQDYFMEDSKRATKRTFLEWVACPKDGLSPMELLREFERRYAQLSTTEHVTLDAEKVELFL